MIQFKGYETLSKIGSGDFSTVYEVLHKKTKQKFALKVFNQKVCEEQIKKEYRILEQFKDDKNFLSFYGATLFNNRYIFKMQLIKRGNLKQYILSNGYLNNIDAKAILHNLIKQLQIAHSNNIIHNDIKPENVLIDNNRAYLIDWGVASHGVQESQGINLTDNLFVSPEHYNCKINFKTDIYTLGHILYYMLHGKLLYELSLTMSDGEVMLNHLSKVPEYRDDLSEELKNLLNGMLCKDYKDRMSLDDLSLYFQTNKLETIYKIKVIKLETKLLKDEDIFKFYGLKNIVIAQFRYALYLESIQEHKKAIGIYIHLASRNFTRAMNNLGYIYETGIGDTKNYKKSNFWYSKAASMGNAMAMYNIALSYLQGRGILKDTAYATKLFTMSAKKCYKKANKYL